jgi:phosphatidylglycerophosphate synthase
LHALRSAQKSSSGAPIYSRFVNRPLGRVFAALAYSAGLTPNQVTAVSAVFTFSGIVAIAVLPAVPATGVVVSLLLVIGYALDSADGQVARLRGLSSPEGEWLDHVCDAAKHASIHLAVAISLFRSDVWDSHYPILVPLAYSVVDSVLFFGFILTERIRRPGGPALATADARRAPLLRSVLSAPTDYGLLCVAFLTLGAPVVFLPLYTLFAVGTLGYLMLALPKWFRDVAATVPARAEFHG